MTHPTPKCPDQASLESVLKGHCSGEALAAIEQHIEECPHCQSRLASAHASWKQLLPASGQLDLAWSRPGDDTGQLPDRSLPGARRALAPRSAAPPPATAGPGQSIGPYQLTEQIARGGMGVVYRATDPRLGRDVAIKLLSGDRVNDANWLERFHREARITGALNHPNIVTLFEVGTHAGIPYLASEFVDGNTLRQRIRDGHCDLAESLAWAVQMAEGLNAAHQAGIIHRDFKPENVMIRHDGLIKILDFGLARPTTESSLESAEQSLSSSGLLIGTVSYMSPEQARGLRVGVESDVFSFATVLYFTLTGSRPFPGKTPTDVSAALLTRAPRPTTELGIRLPVALQKLMMRCFSKTPELRPAAGELCEELRHIATSVAPTSAAPTSATASHVTASTESTADSESFCAAASTAEQAAADVVHDPTQVTGLSDTAVPTRSPPEPGPIQYARSGDVNIAWQEIGNGPIDLVFVMGWVSHLEWFWKHPTFAAFLRRLASFSRVILFDKRGTGLSDKVPVNELPTLETRMDDVRAVMEAAGSKRAVLCGVSEGGPLCTLYAATYPQKTIAIVMMGCYARRLWADDYPWGPRPEQRQVFLDEIRDNWGGPLGIEDRAPSLAADPQFRDWWASYLRMGASPGAAVALTRMNAEIDVRPILPTIQVPTLVLHRTGDRCLLVEEGRHLASLVTGARFVELPGDDHLPFVGDADSLLDEIEEFLTGKRHAPVVDRVLATVLQLSIETGGDTSGKTQQLVDQFQTLSQRQSELFRGENFQLHNRGLMMTFDGPARAVRAANAICGLAFRLKLDIRCGLDTGPCDIGPDGVCGPAVDSADEIAAAAAIQSIVISEVVYHLVSGSGLEFIENTTLGSTRKTFQLIR
ncbi:MAG: alpha/beta fold hydrolase [Planctomycetaceae bacterium]|nr:alpha/beta fold hydrolase [Planctomycetaceae bacterium]